MTGWVEDRAANITIATGSTILESKCVEKNTLQHGPCEWVEFGNICMQCNSDHTTKKISELRDGGNTNLEIKYQWCEPLALCALKLSYHKRHYCSVKKKHTAACNHIGNIIWAGH